MIIELHAELIFTFHTFSQWVNNAGSVLPSQKRSEKTICLDKMDFPVQ